jgi:hypothetical protein
MVTLSRRCQCDSEWTELVRVPDLWDVCCGMWDVCCVKTSVFMLSVV